MPASHPDHVLVYQDEAGEWRWTAKAANGEITADSAEAYTRHEDATRAARDVFGDHARIVDA